MTTPQTADLDASAIAAAAALALVAQFDALVEAVGGYGGQCATPPHVLAPSAEFSNAITAMRRRLVGTEKALEFLVGGPLTPPVSVVDLDDLCRAVAAMQGHHRAIAHLLRRVLSVDAQVRADAARYRALRAAGALGVDDDGDVVFGAVVVPADELTDAEQAEHLTVAARQVPFATAAEVDALNGRTSLIGDAFRDLKLLRDPELLDRAAAFLVAQHREGR